MQFKILHQKTKYTGLELRPHFNLEQTGVYGSLITAFIGECEVNTSALVDMEDRLANDHIKAKSMLHMIGEFFGMSLETGILYQRLLILHAEKILRDSSPGFGSAIFRNGDDLILGFGQSARKLTVSIATVSPVSVLIHWGFNIDPTGAPVKASGLNELNWDETRVLEFAEAVLTSVKAEIEDVHKALCKVRPVSSK